MVWINQYCNDNCKLDSWELCLCTGTSVLRVLKGFIAFTLFNASNTFRRVFLMGAVICIPQAVLLCSLRGYGTICMHCYRNFSTSISRSLRGNGSAPGHPWKRHSNSPIQNKKIIDFPLPVTIGSARVQSIDPVQNLTGMTHFSSVMKIYNDKVK